MKINLKLFGLLIALTLGGCASHYNRINPRTVHFENVHQLDRIEVSYSNNALTFGGNRNYVNKAIKKGVNVMAFKVVNASDTSLNLFRDLQFILKDENPLLPMSNDVAASMIKQSAAMYFLYTPIGYYSWEYRVDGSGKRTATNYRIFPIGSVIALFNATRATNANNLMRHEFHIYDMDSKTVKPGETLYGIVCFRVQRGIQPEIKLSSLFGTEWE